MKLIIVHCSIFWRLVLANMDHRVNIIIHGTDMVLDQSYWTLWDFPCVRCVSLSCLAHYLDWQFSWYQLRKNILRHILCDPHENILALPVLVSICKFLCLISLLDVYIKAMIWYLIFLCNSFRKRSHVPITCALEHVNLELDASSIILSLNLLDLLSLFQDLLHMDLLLYPFYLHQVYHIQADFLRGH